MVNLTISRKNQKSTENFFYFHTVHSRLRISSLILTFFHVICLVAIEIQIKGKAWPIHPSTNSPRANVFGLMSHFMVTFEVNSQTNVFHSLSICFHQIHWFLTIGLEILLNSVLPIAISKSDKSFQLNR